MIVSKVEQYAPWLGVLMILIAILLASGQTYDAIMFFPKDAKPYFLPMHVVPMIVYGLLLAGGLMLTGCLRSTESPWETIPAIVIGLIPLLFGSYPFLGGVVAKGTWMGEPMEIVGIFTGVAILQGARAIWQRKPWDHCNVKRLLLYTGIALLVCAVSITFTRLIAWASDRLTLQDEANQSQLYQLVYRLKWAASYLSGATLLPFLRFKQRNVGVSVTLLTLGAAVLFACVYIVRIDTQLWQRLSLLPEPWKLFVSYIYKSICVPNKVEGASVLFFTGLCGLLPWRKAKKALPSIEKTEATAASAAKD